MVERPAAAVFKPTFGELLACEDPELMREPLRRWVSVHGDKPDVLDTVPTSCLSCASSPKCTLTIPMSLVVRFRRLGSLDTPRRCSA